MLVLITAGAYLRCPLQNGFINYDDPTYITRNPHVTGGLTWANAAWAFGAMQHFWHPVTWLSHELDWTLYGPRAWGHHLTNVLLHTANTVMLYVLMCWAFRSSRREEAPSEARTLGGPPGGMAGGNEIRASLPRLLRPVWPCFFVAALFGVHPLHVEPVAWAAERKEVLAAFFFLLTLLAYVGYVDRTNRTYGTDNGKKADGKWQMANGRWGWYGAALVFFALGLMSKTGIVVLPVLMLLMDWWPLGRVQSLKSTRLRLTASARQEVHPPSPDGFGAARSPSAFAKATADKQSTVHSPQSTAHAPSAPAKASGETRSTEYAIRNTQHVSRLTFQASPWRDLLLEKIPFFLLALAGGIMTILAQGETGAILTATKLPLAVRLGNAVLSCWHYLWQTVWPTRLAVFYSYSMKVPVAEVAVLAVASLAVTVWVVWEAAGWVQSPPAFASRLRRGKKSTRLRLTASARQEVHPPSPDGFGAARSPKSAVSGQWLAAPERSEGGSVVSGRPWFAFGWAWYLITLLPVIGIVQVGSQARADRYMYLPLIGLLVAVVWGVAEWVQSPKSKVQSPSAFAKATADKQSTVHSPQSKVHSQQSAEQATGNTQHVSRFTFHVSRLMPVLGCLAVAACAGVTIHQLGYWQESEKLFRHALAVTTKNAIAHINLGTALEARAQGLRARAERTTDSVQKRQMQAAAASLQAEAGTNFEEAVRIQPASPVAQCDLCNILAEQGRLAEAIYHGQQAVQLRPDYAGAHLVLGSAFGKASQVADPSERAGLLERAIREFETAREQAEKGPERARVLPEALRKLAFALWNKGDTNAANATMREAVRVQKEVGGRGESELK